MKKTEKIKSVKITLNGREFDAVAGIGIAEFAETLGIDAKRCVAEIDGTAYGWADFSKMKIKGGEKIELMKIVAGG